jgi:hypothetical protein
VPPPQRPPCSGASALRRCKARGDLGGTYEVQAVGLREGQIGRKLHLPGATIILAAAACVILEFLVKLVSFGTYSKGSSVRA